VVTQSFREQVILLFRHAVGKDKPRITSGVPE
jgi:hypothetical protein